MATFLAKIKIIQGKEAAFESTAREMFEATHKHEPSCRRYEYWRGAEPGTYYCLESFDDYMGFMNHQASPHHEAPDFGSMIEEMELEWLDPILMPSILPLSNRHKTCCVRSPLIPRFTAFLEL